MSVSNASRKNSRQLEELKQEHEQKLAKLRAEQKREEDSARSSGDAAVNHIRKSVDERVESARKQEQTGRAALKAQAEENQRNIEESRARALMTNEKMQKTYSDEGQRIEVEGTRDVQQRKEKYANLHLEQERSNKTELQELEQEQSEREKLLRGEHEDRIEHTVKTLDGELKNQQSEFKEKYKRDGETYKAALNNQKEIYLKERYKESARHDKFSELSTRRSTDPFYQPKSFDATLTENQSSYELTAKVAPHEKDNVTVRVRDGKAVLSVARAYEQSFEDKGVKASTNSSQTFRQEFKLDKPADTKNVMTQIKDDGSIRAIIPKKGFKTSS